MKDGNAIEVNNITKSFKVYLDRSNNIKDFMIHSKRRRYENRQVLKGISFEVKKGEAIGLIGRNGCGKSTTLKLLTRIMYPDTGSIEIKGRVSSLIELGAGFHPDMSGRENIYINASIFGLGKKEIDRRVDDIIEFSELGDYIDNPVRTYSSGMYMRLAFSVAINVDAEVLLIDEILAVGDANFQEKCFKKMKEIKDKGTTIVIVSHSLGQIEAICDRTIWIEKGLIKAEGDTRKVHREYLEYMGAEKNKQNAENDKKKQEEQSADEEAAEEAGEQNKREGNQKVTFQTIRVLNSRLEEQQQFNMGDDIIIEAAYKVNEPIEDAYFAIDIIREYDYIYCYATNTNFEPGEPVNISQDGKVLLHLKNVLLMEHKYFIDFVLKEHTTEVIDIVRHAVEFDILPTLPGGAITYIEHDWDWSERGKGNE